MMAPRLHCPVSMQPGAELELPARAARHAQVLRLQPGDAVELFHGGLPDANIPLNQYFQEEGALTFITGWFDAVITRMGRSDVAVRIGNWHAPQRSSHAAVHIACGVPTNERMDWLVEKATELGVASIQPLQTRRSVLRLSGERALKRVAHWQAIAVSACEQSGRTAVPWVRPLLTLDDFVRQQDGAGAPTATGASKEVSANLCEKWLLSLHSDAQPFAAVVQAAGAGRAIGLLSGPEGGLDEAEEAAAIGRGWKPVSLGAFTLRAETAPVAALAALRICGGAQ